MNKQFSEIDLFFSNLEKQILDINLKYDKKIDFGGCGTFSFALSEVLNKNDVPHEIVYVPEEVTPPNCYRCDIKFEHVLVKVDDILIDNHGMRSQRNYIPTHSLDKFKLKEMLKDKNLWNHMFPHEEWSNLTQDILNISL